MKTLVFNVQKTEKLNLNPFFKVHRSGKIVVWKQLVIYDLFQYLICYNNVQNQPNSFPNNYIIKFT